MGVIAAWRVVRESEAMRCPVDDTDLLMTERQGVEVDYCPKCRGVWLDRGELDKIIERGDEYDRPSPGYQDSDRRGSSSPKKKKKSFLTEMFEGLGE
jgi:Zn-finger nucleic acid-binding protein